MKEQVERACDGTGGETTQWNKWREHVMEQVEKQSGTGGETTQWNRWREHMMEQVEKQHSRTGGECM